MLLSPCSLLRAHPTLTCDPSTPQAKEYNKGKPIPLWQKAACGLTAGGLGALVGTPADLTLIRMQADSTLPVEHRRNYKGVTDAMVNGCLSLVEGGRV
jgi:hypothetical protein